MTTSSRPCCTSFLWPSSGRPTFIRYAVQRLKAVCPGMGKVKIAQMLCRAGLHLGKTTVERILKEEPVSPPTSATESTASEEGESPERIVIANYPNHVWGLDLTTIPLFGGLRTSWMPNALPQCWPFCWWISAAQLRLYVKAYWARATTWRIAVLTCVPQLLGSGICGCLFLPGILASKG